MKYRKIIIVSSFILLAVIVGTIFYLFQNVDKSETRNDWQLHSQEVIQEIVKLKQTNELQNTLVRAYKESQINYFISEYKINDKQRIAICSKLQLLVSDKKSQNSLFEGINEQFSKKLSVFSKINHHVIDSTANLNELYSAYEELSLLDKEITIGLLEMEKTENDLLVYREQQFTTNVDRSKNIILMLCLVILAIVILILSYSFNSVKRLEKSSEELRNNNKTLERYKQLFNDSLTYSNIAIYDWFDVTGTEFWSSDSLKLMLGLTAESEDLNVVSFFEKHMHPDDTEATNELLTKAIVENSEYYAHYRLQHADGHYIHFKANGQLFTVNGISKMVGAIINTEHEYQANIEKERLRLIQKEFATRFSLTLKTSKYGVWDWLNTENEEQWWSDSFYQLIGYSREEMSSNFQSFNEIVHPEDRQLMQESVQTNLATGEQLEVEYRLKTKHADYQWFRASGDHIIDEDTGATRMIGVVSNIGAEKAIREELERSNAELQNFAYVASHDLQEPLRKIQAFGDRLNFVFEQEDKVLPGAEMVTKMNAAAGRMRTLIQDLLNYSRVSRENQYVDEVNLNNTLTEVQSFLSELIKEKKVTINIQAQLPVLKNCNKGNFFQLFQNLLSNAIKFQPEGNIPKIEISSEIIDNTEAMEISKTLSMSKSYHKIKFTDNGIGFKEEYLNKIFTIFQRLHGRGEYEGTGLGLAICKKICENHGGHITATPIQNEGTTFIIILPNN